MIDGYRFGSMTVDGNSYNSDLKIINGRVAPGWWRRRGHEVSAEDVDDVLAAQPEILVVGCGMPGQMRVLPALAKMLSECGIRLIQRPTDEAVRIFNELSGEGKRVAGAFHLTC